MKWTRETLRKVTTRLRDAMPSFPGAGEDAIEACILVQLELELGDAAAWADGAEVDRAIENVEWVWPFLADAGQPVEQYRTVATAFAATKRDVTALLQGKQTLFPDWTLNELTEVVLHHPAIRVLILGGANPGALDGAIETLRRVGAMTRDLVARTRSTDFWVVADLVCLVGGEHAPMFVELLVRRQISLAHARDVLARAPIDGRLLGPKLAQVLAAQNHTAFTHGLQGEHYAVLEYALYPWPRFLDELGHQLGLVLASRWRTAPRAPQRRVRQALASIFDWLRS